MKKNFNKNSTFSRKNILKYILIRNFKLPHLCQIILGELKKNSSVFNILDIFVFSFQMQRVQLSKMIKDDGHVAKPVRLEEIPLSGHSNIAKSFLINSLRVSRRVRIDIRGMLHTEVYMHTYTHTYKTSQLYTRFSREIVEVCSSRKDSEGRRIKWHTRPRRYRENSPFVTRQTRYMKM